jgi:engulfment and cell motility protein 1
MLWLCSSSCACGAIAAQLPRTSPESPVLLAASESTASLFQLTLIVHSIRVKIALQSETDRPWHEVEQEFLESEYRAVRDRQMKELELEDDLLNKVPVRLSIPVLLHATSY